MASSNPPEGYATVTPSLVSDNPAGLIDFIVEVFEADVRMRMDMPDGSLGHAELQLGDPVIMLGQASEYVPAATGALYVYVDDVDHTYERALAAGAASTMEPADQFYGDRCGAVADPFGNLWTIAKHVEDVSDEEMARRMEAFAEQQG